MPAAPGSWHFTYLYVNADSTAPTVCSSIVRGLSILPCALHAVFLGHPSGGDSAMATLLVSGSSGLIALAEGTWNACLLS